MTTTLRSLYRNVSPLLFLILFFIPLSTLADDGCTAHGGADCALGAQADGQVICADGSTASTQYYSYIEECSPGSCVVPIVLCTTAQEATFESELWPGDITLQQQETNPAYAEYTQCRSEIQQYTAAVAFYQSCSTAAAATATASSSCAAGFTGQHGSNQYSNGTCSLVCDSGYTAFTNIGNGVPNVCCPSGEDAAPNGACVISAEQCMSELGVHAVPWTATTCGCVSGYTEQGGKCVAATSVASTVAPTPTSTPAPPVITQTIQSITSLFVPHTTQAPTPPKKTIVVANTVAPTVVATSTSESTTSTPVVSSTPTTNTPAPTTHKGFWATVLSLLNPFYWFK